MSKNTVFIGIDPGVGGAIAILEEGETPEVIKMPDTEKEVYGILLGCGTAFAVLERQTPRPTLVFDRPSGKMRPAILKSTCLLYGSYRQLRATLTALEMPFEDVLPKRWQKGLAVPPKVKEETERDWKNRLKIRAAQLYPSVKVTLQVADALLLATFAQRLKLGVA